MAHTQTPVFDWPVEGELNLDFFIVNHVDRDTTADKVRDYHCGLQTYDGHAGTDIVLRNFRQMDSGVPILAAAPGRVFQVVDTAFDRQKEVEVSRGFGNYIGIAHPGGVYTYYAHLRKGSAIVGVGDSVDAGERIALVGSSGNSTDPHLHFEVWNDSNLIDPFAGPCSGGNSYWRQQPEYDTSYYLIDHGLLSWNYPENATFTLDLLRDRPPSKRIFVEGADSIITFWVHEVGVDAGDTSRLRWYSGDSLWFSFDYLHALPYRYYYWWSYINVPIPGAGSGTTWRVDFALNQTTVSEEFEIVYPIGDVSSEPSPPPTVHARYQEGEQLLVLQFPKHSSNVVARLYTTDGRVAADLFDGEPTTRDLQIPLSPFRLPSGHYFLQIIVDSRMVVLPILVR